MCQISLIFNTNFSSSDSLPELSTDMECIKLNSSSSSSTSTPSPSTTKITVRRSSRATTSFASKILDEQLHKIKRRTIAKPRRLDPAKLAPDASEKLIEKLYKNRKLTKVKPTNLETIWEEPKKSTKNQELSYVSVTKFRRAIIFKDHLSANANKQKVQARRKRIKRLLGTSQKLKKISMDAFMKHLKALAGEDEISQ